MNVFISNNTQYTPLITLFLILILSLISRESIPRIYTLLFQILPIRRITSILISLILLPGTLLHESAHYVAARLLLIKVRSFSLLPQFKTTSIILGEVRYDRADPIRGTLVGIAPIFAGIGALYYVGYFLTAYTPPFMTQIFILYTALTISATMFSSQEDMYYARWVLPVIFIALLIIGVVLHINGEALLTNQIVFVLRILEEPSIRINLILLVIIGIHAGILLLIPEKK